MVTILNRPGQKVIDLDAAREWRDNWDTETFVMSVPMFDENGNIIDEDWELTEPPHRTEKLPVV